MTDYPKKKTYGEYDGCAYNSCHTQFSTALKERASVESIQKIIDEVVEGKRKGFYATQISNHILNGLEG